jgi:hypothetical protein
MAMFEDDGNSEAVKLAQKPTSDYSILLYVVVD